VTGLLASVATLDEMEVARACGADVVDLKDPARGALGAWDVATLQKAVPAWWSWPEPKPWLSATIGDQPMEPESLVAAVGRVASKGVPMVKLGVFPGGDPVACFAALRRLAEQTGLIAVFFGDRNPDFDLIPEIAAAGFAGVMVDTADKSGGGLRRHMDDTALGAFVSRARALGLTTGLAGSLRLEDVGPLSALGPDYLGFRGALCAGARTGRVTEPAVARIRSALDANRPSA
jgi:uncharacterized protein (UPF0264 family)